MNVKTLVIGSSAAMSVVGFALVSAIYTQLSAPQSALQGDVAIQEMATAVSSCVQAYEGLILNKQSREASIQACIDQRTKGQ